MQKSLFIIDKFLHQVVFTKPIKFKKIKLATIKQFQIIIKTTNEQSMHCGPYFYKPNMTFFIENLLSVRSKIISMSKSIISNSEKLLFKINRMRGAITW